MNWPSLKDFNDAVRDPATAFTDPELAAADPVLGADGRPEPQPGESSEVYQLCAEDGRSWAVKCFARPAEGLAPRYARIQQALTRAAPPFAVGFTFLPDGIFAAEEWCPVLKMDWIEGDPLRHVAREKADDPGALEGVSRAWVELCRQLRAAGVAHGDLQPANVLLVPGIEEHSFAVKLIDYDGMFVPGLADAPAGEAGHPNYRHPASVEGNDSADLDRFPLLAVATALKALAVFGKPLWDRHDSGDNLLFTAADFQTPGASPLMRELWQSNDPLLRMLIGKLVLSCGWPLSQTPWLDDLVARGADALSAEEAQAVAAALALAPEPTSLPPAPARVVPLAEAFTLDEPKPAPAPREAIPLEAPRIKGKPKAKARPKRDPEPARGFPLMPFAIAAAVLLMAGAATAVYLIADRPKPDETAETPPDNTHPKGVTPPLPAPPGPPEVAPEPRPAPPPKPVFQGPPGFHRLWAKPIADERVNVKPFFGADGRAVYVSVGQRLEALDAKTGEARAGFRGPGLPLATLHLWSLDRGRVAIFGHPMKAPGLWDAKSGEPLPATLPENILPEPPPGVLPTSVEAQVSPCGRFVFAGYRGSFRGGQSHSPAPYRVVEVATGKTVSSGDWTNGSVAFTADGARMLMAETNGRVRWVKMPGGEVEIEWAFQPNGFPRMINGLSADGALFLYTGKPPGLPFDNYLVDGKTGQVLRKVGFAFGGDRSTLTADGRWLVGVTPDLTNPQRFSLSVADVRTGETLVRTPVEGNMNEIQRAAVSPDGRGIALHHRGLHAVVVYELRGEVPPVPAGARVPAPLTSVPERAPPGAVAVAPQVPVPPKPPPPPPDRPGFPDAPALKARWTVATETGVMANQLAQAPLFTRDGKTMILSGGSTGTILTFDSKTGAAGAVWEGHKGPGGVYWLSPVGDDRVVSGGFDAKNATWDIKTAKRVDDIKLPELPPMPDGLRGHAGITRVTSPGGRYTVQARKESARPAVAGPLRVLDTTTGKEVISAGWNGGRVLFTADESRVFVLDGLGKAKWYKLPSGEADGEWATGEGIQAETARVLGMTADGKTMLYHGPLKNQGFGVYLLEAKTGEVLRRLGGAPYQAAFSTISPDGRFVAMVVIDFAGGAVWHADVFEVSTWKVVGRVSPPEKGARGPAQFSFTPDGKELAVFFPAAKELSVFPMPAEGARPVPVPVPVPVPAPAPPKP